MTPVHLTMQIITMMTVQCDISQFNITILEIVAISVKCNSGLFYLATWWSRNVSKLLTFQIFWWKFEVQNGRCFLCHFLNLLISMM